MPIVPIAFADHPLEPTALKGVLRRSARRTECIAKGGAIPQHYALGMDRGSEPQRIERYCAAFILNPPQKVLVAAALLLANRNPSTFARRRVA
jgi:hypothetical protein